MRHCTSVIYERFTYKMPAVEAEILLSSHVTKLLFDQSILRGPAMYNGPTVALKSWIPFCCVSVMSYRLHVSLQCKYSLPPAGVDSL